MSTIPQNKEELILSINSQFNKLCLDYDRVPEELSRELAVEGNVKGTHVSVCDTLAYLIGWQKLVIKWHVRREQGLSVDFPEEGFNWQQLGALAQYFHQQYHDWSYKALLAEFKLSTKSLLELIGGLDNKRLYEELWYKNYTLGRMIQFNSSSPMKNMRAKVRRFIKHCC